MHLVKLGQQCKLGECEDAIAIGIWGVLIRLYVRTLPAPPASIANFPGYNIGHGRHWHYMVNGRVLKITDIAPVRSEPISREIAVEMGTLALRYSRNEGTGQTQTAFPRAS